MKKILIIQGSPRRNGNTEAACHYLQQRIPPAADVQLVNLYQFKIHPCLGCRKCMQFGACVITADDFAKLWERVKGADCLVLASPVYWYAPPGPMKDFIDRTHDSYLNLQCLAGKQAHLVTVATEEGFETCEKVLGRWVECYGGKIVSRLHLLAREQGDLEKRPENLKQLDELVEALRR